MTNKLPELKIKRKTLAYEAREIRKLERKTLRQGRIHLLISKPEVAIARLDKEHQKMSQAMTANHNHKPAFTAAQIERIRRRITNKGNSLVYPADKLYITYNELRDHRIDVVRVAARAAHLAHSYLTGRTYKSVEGDIGRFTPKVQAALADLVAKDVRVFGGTVDCTCKPKDALYWMQGGKTLAQEAEIEEAGGDGISSKLAEAV